MSIFKTRSSYYRSIASKNLLIAHGKNINGEVRNAYHRMNDETELLAACINWAHFPCMVHCGFSGRYGGGDKRATKRKHSTELYFLSKVDDINNMDQVEDAYDQAFEAMEQFISYLYNDFITNGYCGNIDNLDLSRFTFVAMQFGGNLFGWSLLFEDEKYPDNLTRFDATKWEEA